MYNASSPPCIIPIRVSNKETANASEVLHVYVIDDKVEKVEEFIVKKGVPVDIKNKLNQTALFVAAFSGSEKTLVKLLQLGADPNKGCGQFFRYTPVHGACFGGSPRVLTYLVEAGGDLRRRDEFGRIPRDWAVGYLNRPAQRMEILAVIESYRQLATSGSSKAVDPCKNPKSMTLRSMAQVSYFLVYMCCHKIFFLLLFFQ
jgi:ankyrin repeat protein